MKKISPATKRVLGILGLLLLALIVLTLLLWWRFPGHFPDILPSTTLSVSAKEYYTETDFGVERLLSGRDENQNGVDDYTDILLGAREDAQRAPRYDGSYVAGGYPPDDVGCCTDTVWRALLRAGYTLRDMVDEDIASFPERYPHVTARDKNIDFRRVQTLRVYFEYNALKLTDDIDDLAAWQPGDIVVFDSSHIGIVSDRRNEDGITYLIHNEGQRDREEDALSRWYEKSKVVGHYRIPE